MPKRQEYRERSPRWPWPVGIIGTIVLTWIFVTATTLEYSSL